MGFIIDFVPHVDPIMCIVTCHFKLRILHTMWLIPF